MEKTSVQLVVFRSRYIVSFNYGRVREKERDKEKRERESGTLQNSNIFILNRAEA